MAIRNNIAKLLARAQVEEDPDVLERIAARIQDALNDKVEHLRGLEAARRSHSEAGSSEQRPESRRTPETDTPRKSARQPYRSRERDSATGFGGESKTQKRGESKGESKKMNTE
jgi:hypothetical protein